MEIREVRDLAWILEDNERAQLEHNMAMLIIEWHLGELEKWMNGAESVAGVALGGGEDGNAKGS